MTYQDLKKIIEINRIPEDVNLMSNSGWECGATEIGAAYYSSSKNEIHLVQSPIESAEQYDEDSLKGQKEKAQDWILLESFK